jgi:hypothetical protein
MLPFCLVSFSTYLMGFRVVLSTVLLLTGEHFKVKVKPGRPVNGYQ